MSVKAGQLAHSSKRLPEDGHASRLGRKPGSRLWRASIKRIAALTVLLAASLYGTASAQTLDSLASNTPGPDPARDAYLDETARQLMLGLRAARDTARLTIDSYTALVRERLGAEVPTLRRNRPFMHGERTVRVRWSRDEPAVVHVLGARSRTPLFDPGDSEFFAGLRTERFGADPLGDPFTFGFSVFEFPQTATRSPLEPGSERYYQFRSGDTTSVRLSNGRVLRAVAVTAVPRYPSIRLVSAIMWIDAESFGLARVAYRLAKPIDRELTWRLRSDGRWSFPRAYIEIGTEHPDESAVAPDSTPDRPLFADRLVNGAFNSVFPRSRLDISTVIAEYELWEMRHWVPRNVTWRLHMTAMMEGVNAAGVVPPVAPVMIDWTLDIEDIRERGGEPSPGTPATAAEALRLWSQEGDSISGALAAAEPGEMVTITPADRQALITSDLLPPDVWEEDRGVDDATVERIAAELAAIGPGEGGDRAEAPSPWLFDAPGRTLRLLRYNPVERLSVGTRLQRDYNWGRAALTARIGTARVAPDVNLTLQRNPPGHMMLVSLYRSLRNGGPGDGRGTPGIYASGDAADFHWSHGATIRFLPSIRERAWLSLRLFAEQDADIVTEATRNRVGAAVAWTPWWGSLESGSIGGGGRVSVRASEGDNPHVRAVAEGALVIPLSSRLRLGLRAGTARVWGDPAPHDLWRIGGSGHWLRGHANTIPGTRVHMARVDLQRRIRFLGFSVFGDWASAGGDDFYAVGAGLTFMDGLLRLEVARGLGGGREGGPDPVLKLHFRGDAWF
ncbi:hypothetical protein [Candidatus Palauibacter sp.]|uniref:hypothetical protein n=1 Tax=Candidatus Palauibacter sp. TaxID=3101350 RepID=UPI003B012396